MATYSFDDGGGGGGGGGGTADEGGDDDTSADAETTEIEEQSSIDSGSSSTTTFTSGDTSGTSYSFDDSGDSDTGGSGGTSDDTQFTSGTGEASTGSTSDSDDETSAPQPDTTETRVERESSAGGGTAGRTTFDSGTGEDPAETSGAREVAEETTQTTLQEGVEGEAGDPRYRDQARNLEDRAIDELGWARGESDVAVVEEDGELVARPTRSAEVRERTEALLDARSDLTDPVPDEGRGGSTGARYYPGAGRTFPAVSVLSAEPEDVRYGVDEESGDVTVGLARNETERQMKENAARRYGVSTDDVVITETTENGRTVVEAHPTREAMREKAEERLESQTGVDLDPEEDIEVEGEGPEMTTSLTATGRARVRGEGDEEFGDWEVRLPEEVAGRDVPYGGERAETVLAMGSERVGGAIDEAAGKAAEGSYLSMAAGAAELYRDHHAPDDVADAMPGGDLSGQAEEDYETAVGGMMSMANVPELALGVKEVGEYVGHGAVETASGRGGVSVAEDQSGGPMGASMIEPVALEADEEGFAQRSVRAGAEAGSELHDRAVEDPRGTGLAAGGALAGSALLMGGAAQVGSRTGLAARAAIQPGEELAGYGGHAVTRTVAGARTADRLFPDREPLIFSEEFAIRSAQRAAAGGGRTWSGGRRVVRGEAELPPSPRQQDLIDTARPEGPTDVQGEGSGHYAGPSEDLGSDTGDILDATLGPPTEAELRRQAERDEAAAEREAQLAEAEYERFRTEAERAKRPPEGASLDEIALRAQDAEAWNRMSGELGVTPETGGGLDMEAQRRGRAAVDSAIERHERAQELDVRAERRRELDARREQLSDFGTEGRGLGFDTESEARGRLEAAQRSEVEAGGRLEVKAEQDIDPLSIGAERIGYRSLEATAPRLSLGLDTELEQRQGQEFEAELEIRSEAEAARELEAEAESEWEFGREAEVEAERAGRRRPEEDEREEDYGTLPGFGADADDEAAIGWVGESIGAFAGVNLGAAASRTPESGLEGADHPFGEAVPGLTEDEREAFDSALDFFGLDNTEGDWL